MGENFYKQEQRVLPSPAETPLAPAHVLSKPQIKALLLYDDVQLAFIYLWNYCGHRYICCVIYNKCCHSCCIYLNFISYYIRP